MRWPHHDCTRDQSARFRPYNDGTRSAAAELAVCTSTHLSKDIGSAAPTSASIAARKTRVYSAPTAWGFRASLVLHSSFTRSQRALVSLRDASTVSIGTSATSRPLARAHCSSDTPSIGVRVGTGAAPPAFLSAGAG